MTGKVDLDFNDSILGPQASSLQEDQREGSGIHKESGCQEPGGLEFSCSVHEISFKEKPSETERQVQRNLEEDLRSIRSDNSSDSESFQERMAELESFSSCGAVRPPMTLSANPERVREYLCDPSPNVGNQGQQLGTNFLVTGNP
jgi:hypothetical protein